MNYVLSGFSWETFGAADLFHPFTFFYINTLQTVAPSVTASNFHWLLAIAGKWSSLHCTYSSYNIDTQLEWGVHNHENVYVSVSFSCIFIGFILILVGYIYEYAAYLLYVLYVLFQTFD